ncbi:MAG: alpha-glucosidase C-terminal domain-containing protein, partial [Paludibacteraceae bacterium]|nr:alpha-glucosidase C-terminal domain-containing protein [Paludibacteraceae bacterium]
AEQTFAYARKYFDKSVVVCINNSTEEQTLELDVEALNASGYTALFGKEFKLEGNKLTITLPALTAEVLY